MQKRRTVVTHDTHIANAGAWQQRAVAKIESSPGGSPGRDHAERLGLTRMGENGEARG